VCSGVLLNPASFYASSLYLLLQTVCACFSCLLTQAVLVDPVALQSVLGQSQFCQILACSFPSSAAPKCLHLLQLLHLLCNELWSVAQDAFVSYTPTVTSAKTLPAAALHMLLHKLFAFAPVALQKTNVRFFSSDNPNSTQLLQLLLCSHLPAQTAFWGGGSSNS